MKKQDRFGSGIQRQYFFFFFLPYCRIDFDPAVILLNHQHQNLFKRGGKKSVTVPGNTLKNTVHSIIREHKVAVWHHLVSQCSPVFVVPHYQTRTSDTGADVHTHRMPTHATHAHSRTPKCALSLAHTHKDFPVSQLCFHQSFSLALQSSVSMVMCCAAWKAVKKLPPWMRDHSNSTGLLSSVCSGLLIIPLCRVMASCTVLSVSSQQTIVF